MIARKDPKTSSFLCATVLLATSGAASAAPGGSSTTSGRSAKPAALAQAQGTQGHGQTPPQGAAHAAGDDGPAAEDLDAPEMELPPTVDTLADRVKDLEIQLSQTREVLTGRQPRIVFGGHLDLGFFVPEGDGSGVIRDDAHMFFPQYAGRYGWVFLGDILAPAVNSRGEPADLGDLVGAQRFDSVHSRGAPGFIANEVNLTLSSALSKSALATASVNFLPRSGQSEFAIGDLIEVDLAQLEWMPTASQKTSFFVGKVDSVIGIEYRDRRASQRFGITPSLIARYTTGTSLGLKMRTKLGPDDLLVIAGAVTNSSNMIEQFHFYQEIDTAIGKVASGRVSLRPPLPFELEVGASGSFGQQDRVRSARALSWFWGLDLQAQITSVAVKAQYLRGHAPGNVEDQAYGLDLNHGGYVEMNWMITPLIGLIGRGEIRDAFVWLGDPNAAQGAERAYLTKSWRGTGGVRFAFSDRVVLKAEFLKNGEYGGIPTVRNDVFTTSLVLIN